MSINLPNRIALSAAALLAAAPMPAFAYMGPGLGLGAIGTALGVVGAILLGLFSILWYPLKRIVRRIRGAQPQRRRIHAPAPARVRRSER